MKAMILVDMVAGRGVKLRRDSESTKWLNDLIWAKGKSLSFGNIFGRDAYRRRRRSLFVSQARCRCERSRRLHQLSLLVHAARRHGQDRPRRNASSKAKVTGSAARARRNERCQLGKLQRKSVNVGVVA